MLCDTLTGFMADEADLSDSYEEYRIFRAEYYDVLIREYFQRMIRDAITVDSVEAVEFYYSQPDYFAIPEQVNLWHILISPTGLKLGPDSIYYRDLGHVEFNAALRDYAMEVYNRIDSGMPFEMAALQYSHDSRSKGMGGYVGWTEPNTYHHPFDSVAFGLEVGEVSRPYNDRDGFHIITISDRVERGIQPIDTITYQAAYNTLKTIRTNTYGTQFIDSLNSQPVDIVYNEAILDTNIYKVDKQVWIAIVNGTDTIDFNDMRAREEDYRSNNRVPNTTVEMKRQMIGELARLPILVQGARNAGIDTLPNIVDWREQSLHARTKQWYSYNSQDPAWYPSKEEIEEYYNRNQDQFKVEKPLTVQHIIVEDSAFGEFLRDQALAGIDFLELAEQYYPGEESIRRELANLGPIGPGDVPDAIWDAAVTLPVGEVSHPVESEFGYHIVRLVDRTDEKTLDMASIEILPILKERHQRKVFAAYRDKLYAHYNVTFPAKVPPVHLRPKDQRESEENAEGSR